MQQQQREQGARLRACELQARPSASTSNDPRIRNSNRSSPPLRAPADSRAYARACSRRHLSTASEGGGDLFLPERMDASASLVCSFKRRSSGWGTCPVSSRNVSIAPVSVPARSPSPLETASAASSSRHQIASSLSSSAWTLSRHSRRSASASVVSALASGHGSQVAEASCRHSLVARAGGRV